MASTSAYTSKLPPIEWLNLPPDRAIDEEQIQIVAQSISGATERLAIWRTQNGGSPTAGKLATTLQELLWRGLDALLG